jgi:hypothetical protein
MQINLSLAELTVFLMKAKAFELWVLFPLAYSIFSLGTLLPLFQIICFFPPLEPHQQKHAVIGFNLLNYLVFDALCDSLFKSLLHLVSKTKQCAFSSYIMGKFFSISFAGSPLIFPISDCWNFST